MPPLPDFDLVFQAFLAQALNAPDIRPPEVTPVDWTAFDAATEARWLAETTSVIKRTGRDNRLDLALNDAVGEVAPQVAGDTVLDFVAGRLDITPAIRFSPDGRDLIYIKINHGFWESMHWTHAPAHDPDRMRTYRPGTDRRRYMTCGFCDGLAALIRRAATVDAATVRFDHVSFGFSLRNGSARHPQVVATFAEATPNAWLVTTGAAIGVTAFFNALFGPHKLYFSDGSFPKDGLKTGALRETLLDFAGVSDRIVFVVPPHLKGIRLDGATTPQEVIFVSVTTVHEAWIATLQAMARHILERFATDDAVMVITQSGVFSAMLGLYLKQAKDELYPDKRLYVFDLGQALDIANPQAAGPYLARADIRDTTLFYIEGAATGSS